jgi:hypothetical protein
MKLDRQQYFFLITFTLVSIFGIFFRLQDIISQSLDYDEIWTWCHYTTKSIVVIFSDLHFPNNHPLHSFATNLSTGFLGNTRFAFRLPALIAGLCIPPMAGFLTWRLIRNKIASLLAFSICTFNGGLVYYSHVARGYSMQTLFVLLAGFSLFAMRNSKTERRLAPIIFLLSSSAVVLTITTGVIFIATLCLLWFLYNVEWHSLWEWLKSEWPFILSFFSFGIICLIWYGLHYTDLKSSQKSFGEDLSSPLLFFSFTWKMLWEISGIVWILVFIPLFSREGRRNEGFCALFLILVLLSAIVTKCGYAYSRIYLPLLPFIAAGAASGLINLLNWLPKKYKKLKYVLCGAFISVLAVSAVPNISKWTPRDLSVIIPEIVKTLPKDVFINYVPTDSYTIWFNCRPIIMPDNFERIAKFSGSFAQVGSSGTIAGQDTFTEGNARLVINPACRREKIFIANEAIEIFHFRPITKNDLLKNRIVLAMIGPTRDKKNYDRLIYSFFKPYKWLLLNSCLRANSKRFKEGLPGADAFVTGSCDAPASGLLELEQLSNGIVHFYVMEHSK